MVNNNTLAEIAKECFVVSGAKGFRTDHHLKQLLLIGTEVAEALDNIYYDGNETHYHLINVVKEYLTLMQGFERIRGRLPLVEKSRINATNNLGEELADIVIRVFTYAEGNGIDIEREVLNKIEVNRSRPYRHGKKF
jgi:NTP pyrophosphatase (non-canonical NTP hydrolase)